MINNLFFSRSDKYEPVATLGTGSFSTVYLVRHRLLECLRAVKVIPRNGTTAHSVLSEARLLKSLHHPGIPTLFEFEEDDENYYLIEEYVEGETLEEFLLNQGHISHNTFYQFSTQLCEIFCYLHNLHPEPILYMDLKPEHIIVCDGTLKLIDFNVSVSLQEAGNLCHLYGNTTYCAPEILKGAAPHPKWDIYAVGKIMLFMKSFLDTTLPYKTQQILKKATAQNPACRYETVDELLRALTQEQNNYDQELSCKKIAVVGSNFGCGTTHIAISLVSVLNYLGYPACYFESGKRNHLHILAEHLMNVKETDGCMRYRHFYGFPNYGPGVVLPKNTSFIQVYDYGSCYTQEDEEIFEADLLLFVCSSGVLKWQQAFDKAALVFDSFPNPKILCNMGRKQDLTIYAQKFKLPVYAYPFDFDPFRVTKEKCRLFSHILQIKRRRPLLFSLKRKLFPKKS